jgi:hypothetical protein
MNEQRTLTPSSRLLHLAAGVGLGLAIAGGGYAIAASSSSPIHGCVENKSRALLIQPRCGRGQSRLVFNAHGPSGPRGPQGPQGPQGPAAVSMWARVDATGKVIKQVGGVQVQHLGVGGFQIFPGTSEGPCAITATPDAMGAGTSTGNQPVTPITATVNGSGRATGTTVLLNNATTGQAVDDGFSVTVQC